MMNKAEITTNKKIELITLGLGFLFLLLVLINQSTRFETQLFSANYVPVLLSLSMVCMLLSFYFGIKPKLKTKHFFAYVNYRQLLRLVGFAALIVYAWGNN